MALLGYRPALLESRGPGPFPHGAVSAIDFGRAHVHIALQIFLRAKPPPACRRPGIESPQGLSRDPAVYSPS